MISVLTPAADYDLTTLAAVKLLLGIPTLDTDNDALLASLITQASAAASDYCGRVFAQETVRQTSAGVGRNILLLTRTPVVSITQVLLDDVVVDSDGYQVSDDQTGELWRNQLWEQATDGRPDYWKIDYVAGYLLPDDVPEAVEKATLEVVKSWYLARCKDGTLKSEEVGDVYQGTYSGQALPLASKQLLAPWRVVVM